MNATSNHSIALVGDQRNLPRKTTCLAKFRPIASSIYLNELLVQDQVMRGNAAKSCQNIQYHLKLIPDGSFTVLLPPEVKVQSEDDLGRKWSL